MKKSKRKCCNCQTCKCSCHREAEGFIGRCTLKFYKYPDNTHKVGVALSRNDDLPDPAKNPREFMIMSLLVAQVAETAKKQLTALDVLTVSKEEIKVMQEEHKERSEKVVKAIADVDRKQLPLPGMGEEATGETETD